MALGCVFMLCAFLVVCGVLVLWGGYSQRQQTEAILARGVPATAKVTLVRADMGRRSNRRNYYYATYQFEVAGQTYEREESVTYDYYQSHSSGNSIEIRYLPENPASTARIASEMAGIGAANNLMLSGAGFLVTALIIGMVALAILSPSQPQAQPNPNQLLVLTPPANLAAIRAALEPQIPAWQKAASSDTTMHTLTAIQAELNPSLDVKEVDYGYCQSHGFYVLVITRWAPVGADAYSYIVDGNRVADVEHCAPQAYSLFQWGELGGGWYLSTLYSKNRTPSYDVTVSAPTPTVP